MNWGTSRLGSRRRRPGWRAKATRSGRSDLAVEHLPEQAIREAGMVAFYLPMHTATRLAVPVIERVKG